MKRLLLFAFALALGSCSRQAMPSNDWVFVSNETGHVTVLDGATGRIEGELATGPRSRGMAFSPDKRIFYVAASQANRIEAWDVHSRKLLRTYNSGTDPERFAISPDGRTAYIANEDHSAVSFLDLPSGRISHEVSSAGARGVGVSPDGKLVVATSETANLAHFIDAATGKLLDSKPVGSRPRFVLFLDGGRNVWVSSEQRGTISGVRRGNAGRRPLSTSPRRSTSTSRCRRSRCARPATKAGSMLQWAAPTASPSSTRRAARCCAGGPPASGPGASASRPMKAVSTRRAACRAR